MSDILLSDEELKAFLKDIDSMRHPERATINKLMDELDAMRQRAEAAENAIKKQGEARDLIRNDKRIKIPLVCDIIVHGIPRLKEDRDMLLKEVERLRVLIKQAYICIDHGIPKAPDHQSVWAESNCDCACDEYHNYSMNAATADRDAVIKDLVYALEQMRNQFIDRKNSGHDKIVYAMVHKAIEKAKETA